MVSSIFFLSVSVKLTDFAIKQPNYSIFAPINTSLAFICPLFDLKNKNKRLEKQLQKYLVRLLLREFDRERGVLKSK